MYVCVWFVLNILEGDWPQIVSNLSMHQNYLEGFLEIQIAGPLPQSFYFCRSGVAPENLYFYKFLGDANDVVL